MKNYYKYILLILTIIMIVIIFLMSSMNSSSSNGTSDGIIKQGTIIVNKVLHLNMSNKDINGVVKLLHYPFRKLCHFTEYFILAMLLLSTLRLFNISINRSIIITIFCFIFSISDEIHQMFNDRTSLFTDCLIDTGGSILFCLIYYLRTKNKS